MQEYVVGKVTDIPDGKGIAVRIGESFFAIPNACPHKGASLCEGAVVCETKIVRCPWHHWNWQLEDGKLEAHPGHGLRTYDVAVDGDDVIVRV
jgi:nitrite reductase (NADH) small subunit